MTPIVPRIACIAIALILSFASIRQYQARIFLEQANIASQHRDWALTESAAARASACDPSLGMSWYYQAVAQATRGQMAAAKELLQTATRRMANPSIPQMMLGEILVKEKKFAEARPVLEEALWLNPKPQLRPEHFWQLLAECRRQTGDVPGSMIALCMGAYAADSSPQALKNLKEAYRAMGHKIPDRQE